MAFKRITEMDLYEIITRWHAGYNISQLSELSGLLRKGDDYEWANVFFHFHQESQKIISGKEFNLESLKKLITNIRNCFQGANSMNDITLRQKNSEERNRINQELCLIRARLLNIIENVEELTVELVS